MNLPTLTNVEQEAVNVVGLLEQVGAALLTANNPKYATSIAAIESVTQTVNAALAPSSPAPASTLPADVVAAVAPVSSGIATLASKTATATQKAAAVSTLLTDAETIGEDVWSFFQSVFQKKAAAPAPATPPVSSPTPAASS